MKKPDHRTDDTSKMRKLTFPDGFQVGITNLDRILKEVADLKLTDTGTIATELLERVKGCNYIAAGAENRYASALLQEFQRKFGSKTDGKNRIEPNKTHAG